MFKRRKFESIFLLVGRKLWPRCLHLKCIRGLGGALTLCDYGWSYWLSFAQWFHLFHVRQILLLNVRNCGLQCFQGSLITAAAAVAKWKRGATSAQQSQLSTNHSFSRTGSAVRMSSVLASQLSCHLSSEILIIISLAYWPRSFFPDVLLLFSWAVPPSKSDQFTISRVWLCIDTDGTYCLAGNVILLFWVPLVAFLHKTAFSH